MGIYVQGYAPWSGSDPQEAAKQIAESARNWAAKSGLSDVFYAGAPSDDGVWISLYPPSGGFQFEIQIGQITFSDKTSIAGPGYHAALVELCDHIQSDLGLAWRWDSGSDETGFAIERNYESLQQEFVDQFLGFCEFYENGKEGRSYALNLSSGLSANGHSGVATPLGYLPLSFFHEALQEPEAGAENARRIFPWWNRDLDQKFWAATLEVILWTEVQWRAPRNAWEEHIHRVAIGLGEQFKPVLRPEVCTALDELSKLSANSETFEPPSTDGIGYLRQARIFELPGPWSINLPAYYIEAIEDEGRTTCFWFGDEEIRGTSLTIESKTAAGPTWSKSLVDQPDQRGGTYTYRLPATARSSSSGDGFTAMAELRVSAGGNKTELLLLSFFSMNSDVITRLTEVAKEVLYQAPAQLPHKPAAN